jgi:signal transduction histidine kinase
LRSGGLAGGLLAVSDPGETRRPFWSGLRPRLLGALVLTAAVTLLVAALALFAPLKHQLKLNSTTLAVAILSGVKTRLGVVPPAANGGSYKQRVQIVADRLDDSNHLATLIIWRQRQGQIVKFVTTDRRRDAPISPALARQAFKAKGKPTHAEANGVLAVAARYRAEPPQGSKSGARYVVELFRPVDYVGQANSVVRSAFLEAAVAGLLVAFLLALALSARLVRRLRLLQTASRSLDERDLDTLVVPSDTVADEIGDLARGFATMHERLRQQELARRTFVVTASHELRTPLTSLDGMLELAADDLDREPVDLADARDRLARARQQARRLGRLASDLLDLSRIDAALELRSEPVELGETARAVAAEFHARAREGDVALRMGEVDGQAWAQADPGSVARIVRILLDNALRVAPPGSTISICVGGPEGEPTLEVSDTGPGVPDDERELIFQRFRRGRNRNDEGGFGLGLAIGTELAIRMGGTLELTDASPGATFRLTMPERPR